MPESPRPGDDGTVPSAPETVRLPASPLDRGAPGAATPDAEPIPGLQAGSRFGSYRLVGMLGKGGSGTVWEAESTETGRRVALKVLDRIRDLPPELLERFRREARLMASLSHPRCVYLFGAEEIDERPAIAMELMPGGTLQDLLVREGPLPAARAVDHALDLLDGLEAASAAGIVHRDIKPSNCFLDGEGRVSIGDFGLSRTLRVDLDLTTGATFLGTPLYASPEQVRGRELDFRSDVYSLGATLYSLLAGRPPFEAEHLGALFARILSEEPAPLAGGSARLPRGLERVVLRAMAKAPEDRFPTYAAFRRALMPFSTRGSGPASRRKRVWANAIDMVPLYAALQLFVKTEWQHQTMCLMAIGLILYFTITEGLWGQSLGKRLLGLRVVGPDGERPAPWRALVRSAALLVPTLVIPAIFWMVVDRRMPLVPVAVQLAGLALVGSTMRRRNGYTGLHDLASGTRVRESSDAAGPARPREPLGPSLAAGEEIPRFGPFAVVRTLWQDGDEALLLGLDPALRRPVWIHRHALDGQARPMADLAAHAPARLRWLQGSRGPGRSWDAFESPSGASFLALLGERSALPWREVREILRGLAEELLSSAARRESLVLSVDRIWIDGLGRIRLLDFSALPPGDRIPWDAPLGLDGWRALIHRTLLVGLEGRRAPLRGGEARLPGVPLPEHAYPLVVSLSSASDRTLTLEGAAGALCDACARPAEVSRLRRAGPLAVLGAPLALLLLWYLSTIIFWRTEPEWRAALRLAPVYAERLENLEGPSPAADGRREREDILRVLAYSARWAESSPWGREEVMSMGDGARRVLEDSAKARPSVDEEEARQARRRIGEFPTIPPLFAVLAAYLGFLSVLAVPAMVSFAAARRGLLLGLFGMAVRRADGGRPSRRRCLLRASVAWAPGLIGIPAGMLSYPPPLVLEPATWALAALVGAGVLRALWRPDCGIPDAIAGTRLVTR